MLKLLIFAFTITVCSPCLQEMRAQSNVSAPSNVSAQAPASAERDATARHLYEEAASYTQKKFAEFERKGLPYDPQLAARTEQEQRDLAARHATRLAASSAAAQGRNLFYLGMLYSLAGNSDQSAATLERYLSFVGANDSSNESQTARYIAAIHRVRKRLFLEAERLRGEFRAHAAPESEQVFQLGGAFANAYRDAGQYERAVEVAREGIESVLARKPATLEERQKRDEALGQATTFLADTHVARKKPDEAVRTLEELRRTGLRLPSATIYVTAARTLARIKSAANLPANASSEHIPVLPPGDDALAPEIKIADWIARPPVSLEGSRGRVVLLNFWATWCGYCRSMFPLISSWHMKYKDRGLTVIGLARYEGEARGRGATRSEELKFLQSYVAEQKLPYEIGIAASPDNSANYGVVSLPTNILIDRQGRVRFITVGAGAEDTAALEQVIKQLLDEPAPASAAAQAEAGTATQRVVRANEQ